VSSGLITYSSAFAESAKRCGAIVNEAGASARKLGALDRGWGEGVCWDWPLDRLSPKTTRRNVPRRGKSAVCLVIIFVTMLKNLLDTEE